MSTGGFSPERMAPEALHCIRWLEIHSGMDGTFRPRWLERGRRLNTITSWEPVCRTDLARFFAWTRAGKAREQWCADHPNLQRPVTTIPF
jgi:hypothetical protein